MIINNIIVIINNDLKFAIVDVKVFLFQCSAFYYHVVLLVCSEGRYALEEGCGVTGLVVMLLMKAAKIDICLRTPILLAGPA